MITLYRTEDCPRCSAIQEVLEALTLAHKVVVVEDSEDPEVPHAARLPVLDDEGHLIVGRDAILDHLDKLAGFKAEWEKFQTDACYCDEEGNVE
jgi:glutaredoxin